MQKQCVEYMYMCLKWWPSLVNDGRIYMKRFAFQDNLAKIMCVVTTRGIWDFC